MIKVINRSAGNVTYNLEELKIRRVFTPNESKDVEEKELNTLFQMDGGAELVKHHLLVDDKEWVEKHFEAPVEYFWKLEDIERCVKEDPIDLFTETLDYAPQGVLELIKEYSWRLPLSDLNKIEVIRTKLGFDVQAAQAIMSTRVTPAGNTQGKKERLRKREEG